MIFWGKFVILKTSDFTCLAVLHPQWGCATGNAATVAHSTKKTTSGKDSVIEGQPLLLFM
jgi:hypothetical protein